MVEIKAKLKIPRRAYNLEIKGRLKLPFEARQKTRLRTRLASGEEVALMLPRGEILRGGDLVVAADGRVIEVESEEESVVEVTCKTQLDLVRAAYHLGNRHVAVQVGDGFLRIASDHVLEDMLKGLGATTRTMRAPFEPEPGAYGGAHRHNDDEQGHAGRIHQYGKSDGHDHDHAHGHDHDHHHHHHHGHGHDHDHGHEHKHAHDHDHAHDHACGHDHDHKHK